MTNHDDILNALRQATSAGEIDEIARKYGDDVAAISRDKDPHVSVTAIHIRELAKLKRRIFHEADKRRGNRDAQPGLFD